MYIPSYPLLTGAVPQKLDAQEDCFFLMPVGSGQTVLNQIKGYDLGSTSGGLGASLSPRQIKCKEEVRKAAAKLAKALENVKSLYGYRNRPIVDILATELEVRRDCCGGGSECVD